MPERSTRAAVTTSLARAQWATRFQFLWLGTLVGVWGVHIPSVTARYALSPRALAQVLFAVSVGSLITLVFAGRLVGRLGARRSAVLGGAMCAIALALSLAMPSFWLLLPVMCVMGAGESTFDIAINAEGAEIERQAARPLMSGFHAMFSVGAMVGAAFAAALLRAGMAPSTQVASIGITLVVVVGLTARAMLHRHTVRDEAQAHFTWPHGPLLAIGVLVGIGLLAEGAMYNWSVLYVQRELHAPQEQAALAYVSFAGAMAVTRFTGDWVRARVSERTILTVSALVAGLSLLLVLWLATPWAAILGFAITGVGLATVVPILYTAATRVPGVSAAAAIASISSLGIVGLMSGPPLIGTIAQATSLTTAMGTIAAACLALLIGARSVSQGLQTRATPVSPSSPTPPQ